MEIEYYEKNWENNKKNLLKFIRYLKFKYWNSFSNKFVRTMKFVYLQW